MARPPAPCGTFSAYKRHKRKGEPVDDACAEAARNQKNDRVMANRSAAADVVKLAIVESPEPEPIDELAEARENLRIVKATMNAGVPTGMAALSKQYADLVALIKRLEAATAPKESKLDELARRRAERRAASSH